MKKSESDEQKPSEPSENVADRLSRMARLNGAWGHYEGTELTAGASPEVHVFVSGDKCQKHTWETTCWCEPYVEFATVHVTVYRHRRMN